MGINLAKIFTGSSTAAPLTLTGASSSRGVNQAFKTSSYASIPYEKAPTVVDIVPTRDAAGNPLLPGYETPLKTWIA